MGKKKQKTNNDVKNKVENFFGTKSEWVKDTLDIRMCDIFGNDKAFNEFAVVAEDENGLYITGTSFVDAPLLDPYRQYNRIVPEVIIKDDKTSYVINN